MLRCGNLLSADRIFLFMNPLILSQIRRIACCAIVVMLTSCGGGGPGDRRAPLGADAVAPPAPAGPASPAPAPSATVPSDAAGAVTPYNELLAPQGPAVVTDADGGEPPYPDLRQLPTLILPFEPVAYGDVSSVSVTAVR